MVRNVLLEERVKFLDHTFYNDGLSGILFGYVVAPSASTGWPVLLGHAVTWKCLQCFI